MKKYRQYCEILGLAPGADAKKVQQSFRARIKKYHPDIARTESDKKYAQLLIEAYSALRDGVPREEQRSDASSFWKKENRGSKASTASYEKGYFSGKRMFENIFANRNRTDLGGFLKDLVSEEMVYPKDEDAKVWEHAPPKKEKPAFFKTEWSQDEDETQQYIRAEINLRKIVTSFENQENRFQRQWAREFIGNLTQAQILYRDICHFAPHLSYKALQRVRQISELITEIRKVL